MSQSTTISAGQFQEFWGRGDFFRLLDASGAVTVEYYRDGREIAEAVNVLPGYGEQFSGGGFDRVRITSATTQTVQFVIREGSEVRYDRSAGNVAVTNWQGAFTQAQRTVTNSSSQMLAANAARRYLLIQNKDATGDIFLNLAGAAATTANGVLIPAGGSLELQGFVCTGAVFAIGSIASNANIVSVEG